MAHYSIRRFDEFLVNCMISGCIGKNTFTAVEAGWGRGGSSRGTICSIPLPGGVPQFEIVRSLLGAKQVRTGYEPFDSRFRVRCENVDFAVSVLTPDVTEWLAGLDESDHLVRCGVNMVHRTAFMPLFHQLDLRQAPAMAAALMRFVGHLPAEAWA
jgi:hypothetical protein